MSTASTPSAVLDEADFVVVGAGSAGVVIASRLSEDPERTVVLIDRGGLTDRRAAEPAQVFSLSEGPASWPVQSAAQRSANGAVVNLVAGTGLGGSSAINAMGWFHGHPRDYDEWETCGGPGWGWKQTLKTFRRIENHELGESRFHGVGGPMTVTSPRQLHPLGLNFLEAGKELGWPHSPDLNGDQRIGVGLAYSTIQDGARHSVVDGYLKPVAERPNLRVVTGQQVTQVLWDGVRAVGVLCRSAGEGSAAREALEIRARRGVVLTCGALRTPQVLMVSGVGPREELLSLGIDVVSDVNEVGRNLHDHPTTSIPFALKNAEQLHDAFSQDPQRAYSLARRGPLSTFGQTIAAIPAYQDGFDRHDPPDLHIGMAMMGVEAGAPSAEGPDGVLLIALIAPHSRGRVKLASADPLAPPDVDPQYLTVPPDRDMLRAGVRHATDLLTTNAFSAEATPLSPPPVTDSEIDLHINTTLGSYYHYSGTARMGRDAKAVVTPDFRVRGTEALWVADASVMPCTPRGLSQAPTIAIAEHAAPLIASNAG